MTTKSDNKHNRLQQLTIMLKTHPEGLRRAEIARRLGVHRSTVGRYIDQLSLRLPLWEKNSLIGLESDSRPNNKMNFSPTEGTFMLSLIKLYQQEINIKNPHASSVMRKLSEAYKDTSPILSTSFLEAAETLDVEESTYSKGYVEYFEKLSRAWLNNSSAGISYLHKSTGESCTSLFEPRKFFTVKDGIDKSVLAVQGICRRTGGLCYLNVADFAAIVYPVTKIDIENGYQHLFCPISEYALCSRPLINEARVDELNIQESNHRIKNSLFMTAGLIDITFSDIEDDDLKFRVRNLQSRVDAIALIHEQLAQAPGSDSVNLYEFINDLVLKAIKIVSVDHEEVKKRIKIDNIALRSSKALPLGMIIAELITNSFKHSAGEGPPSVNIGITGVNGVITLRYSDGGSGFRLGAEGDTCGSDIIRNFCRQLECTVSYKKNIFVLEFPK